ncbi:MAG TPA: hypothetical protein VK742_03375 [Candidatus Sulfotelmatobacter sp.]|jgi:hypothetical protein|nr:hypothetical protein [Candidatus Sulfotelmatobacter sp.]
MKHIIAITFLSGCFCITGCMPVPVPGSEQTSPAICGRVLDVRTSQPVQGARVQIHGRPKTYVYSNAKGEFLVREVRKFYLMSFITGQNVFYFPPVPVRSYLFDVSHPDYETLHLFGLKECVGWAKPGTNESSQLVVRDILLAPRSGAGGLRTEVW